MPESPIHELCKTYISSMDGNYSTFNLTKDFTTNISTLTLLRIARCRQSPLICYILMVHVVPGLMSELAQCRPQLLPPLLPKTWQLWILLIACFWRSIARWCGACLSGPKSNAYKPTLGFFCGTHLHMTSYKTTQKAQRTSQTPLP